MNYAAATKNRRMIVVRDDIDAGSGPGKFKVYSAGFATLLAEFELDDPASQVIADTLTILGTPLEVDGIVSGTAAIARITDSDDNAVADLSIGETGSNADAIIDSAVISAGQTVRVRSASITHA